MNIALPANGRRVAKDFRDRFDGVFDVGFSLFLCVELAGSPKRDRREDCSCPSSKIFRGKIFACDLTQILVYILGSDVVRVAFVVEILKEVLTGQILQLQDNLRDPAVSYIHFMLAAALAAKTKPQLRAFHVYMSILHGRKTERFVFARILFIADADETSLEKLHDCREHFLPRQTAQSQIFLHTSANFRERFSEADQSIVFVLIAYFPPALVISILFPSPVITSGRLDVPVGRWTNPDIAPRWWNSEPFDTQQSVFVTNRLSLRIKIFEFLALPLTRKAGLIVAHVTQSRVLCCFHRLSRHRRTSTLPIPVAGLFCEPAHVI